MSDAFGCRSGVYTTHMQHYRGYRCGITHISRTASNTTIHIYIYIVYVAIYRYVYYYYYYTTTMYYYNNYHVLYHVILRDEVPIIYL